MSSHEGSHYSASQVKKTKQKRKFSLAALLVERGHFACLDEAERWVMAGKILVNGQRFDKPGMLVPQNVTIRILGKARYASRAGYKLEAALAHFAINPVGCIALDCGASTGGFTDCLLQHGAAFVYAVDAGHGQLIGRLRSDPRVRNLERTNLSDLTAMQLSSRPTLITLDLSYLSLTQALPVAAAVLAPAGQILTLVKPLFEVANSQARQTGQIDDPQLLVAALEQVIQAGAACGLALQGVAKLALLPRHGVHEFVASFLRGSHMPPGCPDGQTLLAIINGQGIGRVSPE
ncbi:TlyA family RNA methyltransferase [Dictyobacter formicarum]|uniref:TlyA family RNA methyltransferase n=1 Tax=Dictyobacter formicarum TaxID=2778368 RepID=UPI0019163471|nr:TlyA family RNA methyltransferase [Dictyobacter formicarum]